MSPNEGTIHAAHLKVSYNAVAHPNFSNASFSVLAGPLAHTVTFIYSASKGPSCTPIDNGLGNVLMDPDVIAIRIAHLNLR